LKALVVDANVSFAGAVANALRAVAEVETLQDGAEAIAAVRARSFDLVVAEWLLPTMDGLALLRALRERAPAVPFVMCTVLSQREAHEYAVAAGAQEVLVKPLSAEVVASTVAAHLKAASVPSLSTDSTADERLARFCAKPAWRDLGKSLITWLNAATGAKMREAPARAEGRQEPSDARAALGMVDVRSHLRLELGLFMSLERGRELVRRALRVGDPRPQDVAEFLSEMCNQVLGAVKAAFRSTGMQFTLFVPRTRFVHPPDAWKTQFPSTHTLHLTGTDGMPMCLVLGAKASVHRNVQFDALRENMVLVDDLRGDDGAVLVTSATRLTADVLVRVRPRLCGQSVRIAE
jgi:CheY-like chemotaxis protein